MRLPCTRFAAGRSDLLVAQRLAAAFADALRGENFDDIGAVCHGFLDKLPDLLGSETRIRELVDRGQEPRPGKPPARDRSAQRHVARSADALHGGEPRHQHGIGVLGAGQRLLGRRLAGIRRPAVLAEVFADVDMRVDHPRQHREPRKVVGRMLCPVAEP
jgi:hypothetical protein